MDTLSCDKKYGTGAWIVLFLQCQSPWLPAASAAHFSWKNLLSKDYVPKTELGMQIRVRRIKSQVLCQVERSPPARQLPFPKGCH